MEEVGIDVCIWSRREHLHETFRASIAANTTALRHTFSTFAAANIRPASSGLLLLATYSCT